MENDALRRKIDNLERQLQTRSPSRASRNWDDASILSSRDENVMTDNLTPRKSPPKFDWNTSSPMVNEPEATSKFRGISLTEPESMAMNTPKRNFTPGKKMRKLTARKWDLAHEEELEAYC